MSPRREADLDAEDAFLPLALGLLSFLRRFDRFLETMQEREERAAGATLGADERATMLLILGVIAWRSRLLAHLEDAGARTPKLPTTWHAVTAPRLDLLR
jgi:hypothetical protein